MQIKVKNREALLSHGDAEGRKIVLDITEKTLQQLDAYERIKRITHMEGDVLCIGRAPDAVFAGFHLYNPSLGKSEPDELVDAVGEKLRGDKVAHYFTGHCTGKEAYERLKRKLGDRLGEMPAGSDFTV